MVSILTPMPWRAWLVVTAFVWEGSLASAKLHHDMMLLQNKKSRVAIPWALAEFSFSPSTGRPVVVLDGPRDH